MRDAASVAKFTPNGINEARVDLTIYMCSKKGPTNCGPICFYGEILRAQHIGLTPYGA